MRLEATAGGEEKRERAGRREKGGENSGELQFEDLVRVLFGARQQCQEIVVL